MKRLTPFIMLTIFLLSITIFAENNVPAGPSTANYVDTQRIFLTAVGDINFNSIGGLILKDMEYPWKATNDILQKADILVGNLEVPLSNRGSEYTQKTWILRADPRTIDSLTKVGFDILTLANNHIMDYGPTALQDTLSLLDKAQIARTGAGMNLNEARQPAIYTAPGGIRFAFLSYSLTYPEIFWANSTRPGTPYGDPAIFVPDIKKAKELADHVVVSFHWSNELQYYPSPYQKNYGRLCIDAGASMVLGHHPHVLQGIEVYKEGLIAYSLGNFVFGSYSKRVKDSIILEIECSKDSLIQAKIYPINVYNPEVQFQPRFHKGSEALRVLNDMRTYSSQFKTLIDSQDDIGIIRVSKQIQ